MGNLKFKPIDLRISSVLLIISLLSLSTCVFGGFVSPVFEPVPGLPEDVEFDTSLNPMEAVIPENIPADEDLLPFRIARILVDTPNVDVSIRSTIPTTAAFDVEKDGNDFYFVLAEKLDREAVNEFFINFEQGAATSVLKVKVKDQNDIEVTITGLSEPVKDFYDEFGTVPLSFGDILFEDADIDDVFTFSVEELIGTAGTFEVVKHDNRRHELRMVKQLDYKRFPMHRINIVAFDGIHTDKYLLSVYVDDIPNQPPEWQLLPPIPLSIPESKSVNDPLTQIEARDGDYKLNWDIEYTLTENHAGPPTQNYLQILNTEGKVELSLINEIDAEEYSFLNDGQLSFTVDITAQEIVPVGFDPSQGNSTVLSVTVIIQDENDQPPEVCTVSEPLPDFGTTCKEIETFTVSIPEDHVGVVSFNGKVIVVRDLDPTISFARYSVEYKAEQGVKDAFDLQPREGSVGSGVTEYTLQVKDKTLIDFEGSIQNPAIIELIFKETGGSGRFATASISITITDVNDEEPKFDELEYTIYVCENMANGDKIPILSYDPEDPPLCDNGNPTGGNVFIKATDADAGSVLTYRWYQAGIANVAINEQTGELSITNSANFDFEVFREVLYIAEVSDGTFKPQVAVRFRVLDVNDNNVILDASSTRPDVDENESSTTPIVIISATSVDQNPDIEFADIEIISPLVYSQRRPEDNMTIYADCDDDQGIGDQVKEWFKLEWTNVSPSRVEARLILGTRTIDREGCGKGDIDRVDLRVKARDLNYQDGEQWVTTDISVTINDVNDNSPTLEGGDLSMSVEIPENLGEEAQEEDVEVATIRATDADLNTNFFFDFEANGCGTPEICQELKDRFSLVQDVNIKSKATLIRKRGFVIDREDRKYFQDDKDILKLTVFVSDADENDPDRHDTSIDVDITVDDLNDNIPVFDDGDRAFSVDELALTPQPIFTFRAQDEDSPDTPFGKIHYEIRNIIEVPNNGFNEFSIDENTGILTSVPGSFEWSDTKVYRVTIRAKDNYRPNTEIGSNFDDVEVEITVIDGNNHSPEFITELDPGDEGFLVQIPERDPVIDKPLDKKLEIQDLDDKNKDGNGVFEVELVKVTKKLPDGTEEEQIPMPFGVGVMSPHPSNDFAQELEILPKQLFESKWGEYTLTFEAQDQGQPPTEPMTKDYKIKIVSENLNAPVFVYPPPNGEGIVAVSVTQAADNVLVKYGGGAVDAILATDDDDGSIGNGRVNYQLVPDDDTDNDLRTYFIIDSNNRLFLTRELTEHPDPNFANGYLSIRAFDEGTPTHLETFTRLRLIMVPQDNREPFFEDNSDMELLFPENIAGAPVPFRAAIDLDADLDLPEELFPQTIYYHIVEGRSDLFEIDDTPTIPVLKTLVELDREEEKFHHVLIFVSNSLTPPSILPPRGEPQYLQVNIEVENDFDEPPVFKVQGVITAGFSVGRYSGDVISNIEVDDPDDDDVVTFTVTDNRFVPSDPSLGVITKPFNLQENPPLATQLELLFAPQANMKGFYTFQITATDLGGQTSTAECKIYMIKESNVVQFRFLNRRDDVIAKSQLLTDVLSEAFQYRCNIDKISEEPGSVNKTIVETHFVNLQNNEPVEGTVIEEQQYNPDVYSRLAQGLTSIGITLAEDGIGRPKDADESSSNLVVYILVGACGLMAVILLVMSATCYFNNRSLNRRVRALTATTFGSQQSGLNRTGAAMDLPNVNEFAIEGSNPLWTTDPGKEKKVQAFDAESIGSGGSVLIGVEDDDDFKNYKGVAPPQSQFDDDFVDSGDMYDPPIGLGVGPDPLRRGSRNALYQSDAVSQSSEDSAPPDYYSDGGGDIEFGGNRELDMPPPAGFGGTTRTNPLANMAFEDYD